MQYTPLAGTRSPGLKDIGSGDRAFLITQELASLRSNGAASRRQTRATDTHTHVDLKTKGAAYYDSAHLRTVAERIDNYAG